MGRNAQAFAISQVVLTRDLSPEQASALIARTARRKLSEVEARQGKHPVTRFVDGMRDASEDKVKPTGVIVYEIALIGDVVDAAFNLLLQLSPVGPGQDGHYRDRHRLFVNGRQTDAIEHESGVVPIPPGAEVVIANLQPYARKIEKGSSLQAPDGVYEIAARQLRQRFGNVATIRFEYRQFPGFAAGRVTRESRSARRRLEMFPALVIGA